MTVNSLTDLENACRHALLNNLGLEANERVLIVTDANRGKIAEVFFRAAKGLTTEVEIDEIPILAANGQEPPELTALRMQHADVVLLPLTKSLSWTDARMQATTSGARIASMAGITEEIILRTFPIDYIPIRDRVNRVCDLLDEAGNVRVTSALGTDLTFSIAGREAHGRKGGIYTQKGFWGNLPCGEAFIAPVEDSAEGIYIVDASHAGINQVDAPIHVSVKHGLATEFSGGAAARQLAALLQNVNDPNAYHLAEFGIGCNHCAEISGTILEDEKVLGTCHFALGTNAFFGGRIKTGVHVDGVLRTPSIWFDDKVVMRDGRLCL